MILNFIRWSLGYVCFNLTGKFPERFINICNKNGINIWDTMPNENGLKSKMSISDYKKIHKYAKKSRVKLRIYKKNGAPFIFSKHKARTGLLIGAVISIALIIFLSSFVWSVNIIGTETISKSKILQVLNSYGLHEGSFKTALNIQKIQRDTILEIPQIGWMSINVVNSVANVEIKEKAEVPEIINNTTPCNLVATKDGVITSIQVANGTVSILRGSAVTQGQLLVNSVVENQMKGINFVHSTGEIFADVEEKKSYTTDLTVQKTLPTENISKRYLLHFFNFNIPCSIGLSNYANSIKQTECYRLKTDTNTLPIGFTLEKQIEYKNTNVTFSVEEARLALYKKMVLNEVFSKSDCNSISRSISGGSANESYTLNVSYVCNENIATPMELSIIN